jgi:hypothetical protein
MTIHHRSRRICRQGLRIAFVTLLACSLMRPAPAADGPSPSRVRSSDPPLAALIDRAAQDSPTFQKLLRTLETSDGIVYVEPGECGHGVWACLKMWMSVSGPNRYMRILVNRRKAASDVDCMGGIGHELQHAIEGLSQPGITNGVQLYYFFRREGQTDNDRFETKAAIMAGDAVRDELRERCGLCKTSRQ